MADQNITELPIKTNTGVASTDYMLGIDSAEGYQILVRDVAKYIVENYNGSTLAGSAQPIQAAFSSLDPKIYTSASALRTGILAAILGNQSTYATVTGDASSALTGGDTTNTCRGYFERADSNTLDYIIYNSPLKKIYTGRIGANDAVSNVSVHPTRAEVDELNSNLTTQNIVSNTDLNTITSFGYYQCLTSAIATTLLNCPTANNFVMQVYQKGNYVTQMLTDASSIYVRTLTSTGFSLWYRYSGTAMS